MLIPTGRSCEDCWLLASALAPLTERLQLSRRCAAGRPVADASRAYDGDARPTVQRARPDQRRLRRRSAGEPRRRPVLVACRTLSRDRGIPERLQAHSRRRSRSRSPATSSASRTRGCRFRRSSGRDPPLYFGGSSEAAHDVAARTIDKYLSWGEPPQDVAAKFADFRARAEKAGREVTLGVRLHLIVRETTEAAWAAANRLIEKLDDAHDRRMRRKCSPAWIRSASSG